jgi:type IV secretion system protein VirB8
MNLDQLKKQFFSKSKKKKCSAKKKIKKDDYFTRAQSWADDLQIAILASRNQYRLAFYCSLGVIGFLALAISTLVPVQHIEPFLVHHYENGNIFIERMHQTIAPENRAETEADLVRYVITRESYSAKSYEHSYELTTLMSTHNVSESYMDAQSKNKKTSFVRLLGSDGERIVKVVSVDFIDKASLNDPSKGIHYHRNLADINFLVKEKSPNSDATTSVPYTATISWKYEGIPANPAIRWEDWNGFVVTEYQLKQRIV